MAGANHTAARADNQLAPALQHVDAHLVDEGASHLSGAPHTNVVSGVGTLTTAAVRGQ